jgi:WD40 repeat protein
MLRVWDAQTGREIRSFKGLVGSGVRPLAFSRDGKRLATFTGFGDDGALRIWDVASGTECTPAAGHALNITCLAFTADGNSLVSGSDDRTVRLWETKTGKELKSLAGHNALLSAVAISPDGKTIVSGDENAVVQIWDTTLGTSLHRLALKPAGDKPAASDSTWISLAMFAADGKTVWIGSQTKLLRGELAQYDVATGNRLRAVSQPDSYPRALSPDASLSVWTQRLRPKDETDRAFGNWEEKVVVRRMGPMDKGDVAYPIKNEEYQNNTLVKRVTFSPDGKFIAIHSNWLAHAIHRSANVPCFRIIEAATGKGVVNKSSADYPWTLFVPGGPTLAGSYTIELPLAPVSGFVRHDLPALGVVNATTDKVVGQLPSYPRHGGTTAVSSNAEFLATVAGNRTILVWDVSKLGRK